jgi:hypothetical protein
MTILSLSRHPKTSTFFEQPAAITLDTNIICPCAFKDSGSFPAGWIPELYPTRSKCPNSASFNPSHGHQGTEL